MIYKHDPASIKGFLEDTSNLKSGHTPGVFFPETVDELAGLLKGAAKEPRTFTIAGNGTGTTGGRIPLGDYVISTQKLDRIGEPVPLGDETAYITVQAGALLETIQKTVEQAGWFYPPDPTEKLCFIGSTIANNSSGARSFKYGATRKHIARILVVLPQGDLLDLSRGSCLADEKGLFRFSLPEGKEISFKRPEYRMPETSKHNAGYFSEEGMDLIDLFIGSEGTLGIIAEADLMLIPLPETIISCLVYFRNIEDLFLFVSLLKNPEKGLSPRAIEFFDHHSLEFLSAKYSDVPLNSEGAIFFEQETTSERKENDLDTLFSRMESCNAMTDESWLALDRNEQERLREFRHALPLLVNDWLSRQHESKISTDMAVPERAFRELFDFYRASCERQGFVYIIFGHIGNAHVHLNILPRNREEFLLAKVLYREFVGKALQLGGTVSAEHGIGKLKAEYLVGMYHESGIREMVRVKKCLDPFLVLNRGNLIPAAYLETEND
ncbi:MAG: FAD-binding oxidoreductase [Chlorobiaceae bacterium]|nr:FAD-binding oxidoreductase [Chlorobiaceae bacterium]NTV15938.1 FAD-binding oxidoreductase [Chlorobiaceae bacterium]